MKKFAVIILSFILFCTISTGVSAHSSAQNLSNTNAIKIANNASTHFWNALHGYKNTSCTQKTFNYKGKQYSYLCKEFNTKDKLVTYLSEKFTNNSIQKGLNKYNYITYNGKLARAVGDGSSMLTWSKAKVKLVYQRPNVRSYTFTVPTVEGDSVKRTVTFYKSGSKWKVNQFDAVQ
ncbi:hypothetical protein ELQ35_12890 [Peribacillus cavernae]|uniref:IseA DL-endopeptidase inhibitor n=1 Tax=Peribacillus cavernae TaxID=1674310 RepID=A0A3S0VAH9_9BACI|nr:IseA DL-endopeptidase inhibitor family protein [Peribacillus cavernae]MDQ0217659.1 hypothetical protein [Peribacillus cavernae]RUQ28134.1 hypothetical protein ELQ35_12890 [Peribacillus cavernae]